MPSLIGSIRDPSTERIALFAGQRVRLAELLIETGDRKPCRVLRATFTIFQFDERGCVDADRYEKQQMAMVEVTIVPAFGNRKPTKNIVDAKDRFIAQGGSWSAAGLLTLIVNRLPIRILCRLLTVPKNGTIEL